MFVKKGKISRIRAETGYLPIFGSRYVFTTDRVRLRPYEKIT